jgi:hypothetical protein
VGALLLSSLVGCSSGVPHCTPFVAPPPPPAPKVDYALVELRTGSEHGTSPQVEITQTDAYRAAHATFHAAAIRLPDSCLATTSAGATGVSREGQTQNILSTQCGVWLQELERALTQIGFKVFSWDALLGLERQKNISPYEAGHQLGAEVVFVFNSLDASPVQAGTQAKTSFKYFHSNAKGGRSAPLALDDGTRAQFRDFIKKTSGLDSAKGGVSLSCTLNSTAIVTGGTNPGESIWFYKRTVTIPVKSGGGARYLFAREEGGPWTPAAPDLPKVAPAVVQAPQASSEDIVESQTSAAKEDNYAAERDQLIHAAAADFVSKFQSGDK